MKMSLRFSIILAILVPAILMSQGYQQLNASQEEHAEDETTPTEDELKMAELSPTLNTETSNENETMQLDPSGLEKRSRGHKKAKKVLIGRTGLRKKPTTPWYPRKPAASGTTKRKQAYY